ncbi:hypothetical protein BHE74_00035486 [Ensete ventricosum]|nr:hypothetical protein BHE74_00035486 [Ensete ventricosum]
MSAISWRPSVRGVARGLAPRPVLSPRLARRSLSLIPDLAARPISSLVARRRAHGGGLGNPGDAEDGEEEGDNEISSDDVVRTLLIDNYDSYTYNIYQELSVVNGGELLVFVDLSFVLVLLCFVFFFFFHFSEIEHTGCDLFKDIPSGINSGFKVSPFTHILATCRFSNFTTL